MDPNSKPYSAIFLHPESRDLLLRWWVEYVQVPLLSDVHADHVTLIYDPSPAEQQLVERGAARIVRVVGWNADPRGQAVSVEGLFASKNKHPHVTVSVAWPTEAVYSNALLAERIIPVAGPDLHGTIDLRFN